MRAFFPRKYYKGPASDHFDGKYFFNPWNPYKPSLWKAIYWKMTAKRNPWPPKKNNLFFDCPPERIHGAELRISYVGHSCVLIQTQGLNILTDPNWSQQASPLKLISRLERQTQPGIPFEKLPSIDYILISHNHYDHLDLATLKELANANSAEVILPLGNKTFLASIFSFNHVHELDWFESLKINSEVSIYLMPSQHWSARGLFDKNKALWGAFVIATSSGNLFFCGDSGYGGGHSFQKAREQFSSFRFAMLPIGSYSPRWFMENSHMTPEEAVLACKQLGEPDTLAIHFNTFRLGDEDYNEPIELLNQACKKHEVSTEKFRILQPGEVWDL